MYIVERSIRFMRGALLSYGPSMIKRFFWDKEYSSGKWNFNDNTTTDCVYPFLEKYAENGNILDLGCGSGNTANELAFSAYHSYLGVDISESALEKARRWSEESGRGNKNSCLQGDFLSYLPPRQFDVILFRESLYHVPVGKVKATLDRYANYLTEGGVFIVRLFTADNGRTKHRPAAMVGGIETEFDVVEKHQSGEKKATVLVFRPWVRGCNAATSSQPARISVP